MTRFEYLKENLTQRELAKYLAEFEDCQGECREFCNKRFASLENDENFDCVDVLYEYLGLEMEDKESD